jgi:hypothetical protein
VVVALGQTIFQSGIEIGRFVLLIGLDRTQSTVFGTRLHIEIFSRSEE